VSEEKDPPAPLDFGPDEEPPSDPAARAAAERAAREADERDRWAHRRDPDLRPEDGSGERPMPPPRMPAGASRYGWFVGVVAVLLIAYITINALRSNGVGSKGLRVGSQMPPFAAPLATSKLDGDVNVARRSDQGSAGKVPACSVRGPGVLNSCVLERSGPVVLAFTVTSGGQCVHELDAMQRLRPRHPGVQFAAVAIRGDRGALRAQIRRHGWTFPVGYDKDGILANLYGVAVCPQITYALPGGKVTGTSVGVLEAPALERRIARLEAEARRHGWRPGR
jgi:hypothetical protein